MSGGGVHVQAEAGLLPLPHLRPHLPHSHHVLDQFLDQARGCPRPGDPGRDLPADPLHPARQQPEVSTSRLLHQGENNSISSSRLVKHPVTLHHIKRSSLSEMDDIRL